MITAPNKEWGKKARELNEKFHNKDEPFGKPDREPEWDEPCQGCSKNPVKYMIQTDKKRFVCSGCTEWANKNFPVACQDCGTTNMTVEPIWIAPPDFGQYQSGGRQVLLCTNCKRIRDEGFNKNPKTFEVTKININERNL